jgi:hypothetical protein
VGIGLSEQLLDLEQDRGVLGLDPDLAHHEALLAQFLATGLLPPAIAVLGQNERSEMRYCNGTAERLSVTGNEVKRYM